MLPTKVTSSFAPSTASRLDPRSWAGCWRPTSPPASSMTGVPARRATQPSPVAATPGTCVVLRAPRATQPSSVAATPGTCVVLRAPRATQPSSVAATPGTCVVLGAPRATQPSPVAATPGTCVVLGAPRATQPSPVAATPGRFFRRARVPHATQPHRFPQPRAVASPRRLARGAALLSAGCGPGCRPPRARARRSSPGSRASTGACSQAASSR
jgi:hypothetical protein